MERGWVCRADVSVYAAEKLIAGDDRAELVELATAEDLEPERVVDLLRRLARLDDLPSQLAESAMRRWMLASLKAIAQSGASPDEKLDQLEETYAMFGYPDDMRECSRYHVSAEDRARGIPVGEVTSSPLDAMNQLLSQLASEFGLE